MTVAVGIGRLELGHEDLGCVAETRQRKPEGEQLAGRVVSEWLVDLIGVLLDTGEGERGGSGTRNV